MFELFDDFGGFLLVLVFRNQEHSTYPCLLLAWLVGGGGDDSGGAARGGPGRRQPANKQRKGRNDNRGDDGRNNRKASLRIGTGRKGRGAELNRRRGSLKKRDRSAEKEARAEAAMERKTVNLPE